VCEKR